MIKKILKHIVKGINTDNDKAFQPKDTVRKSHNGSIIHSEEDSNYTWKNIKGSKKLSWSGAYELDSIIGMIPIKEESISLEVDVSNNPLIFHNPTLLIAITSDSPEKHMIALTSQLNDNEIIYYPLLIDDNLNLSADYPIRDYHIEKEHEDSIKVYFNDTYNSPRVIELINEISISVYRSKGYLFDIKAEYLDFAPDISQISGYMNHDRNQIGKSGELYCRSYFVTHRLIFSNGASTNWSPMVERTVIPKNIITYFAYLFKNSRYEEGYGQLEGGQYNDTSRFSLDINIDNLPDVKKTIQIAVFDSIAYNTQATGTIIVDEELDSDITSYSLNYKGGRNVGSISVEDVMATDRPIRNTETMTFQDNRLVIGNFLDDFSLLKTDNIELRKWKNVELDYEVYYLPFNDFNPGLTHEDEPYNIDYLVHGLKGNNSAYKGDFVYNSDSDDYDFRYSKWFKTWYKNKDDGTYFKPTIAREDEIGNISPAIRIKKYKKNNGDIEYKNIDVKGKSNVCMDYKGWSVASLLKGYWRDEWYRIGIIPWKSGRSLGVRWLGDIKMPSLETEKMLQRIFRYDTGNYYVYDFPWNLTNDSDRVPTNKWLMKVLSLIINNLDITDLVEEDESGNPTGCSIDGFSIVRAPRDENILSEGIATSAHHYVKATPPGGIDTEQYVSDGYGDETVEDNVYYACGLTEYWRGGDFNEGDFRNDSRKPRGATERNVIKNSFLYYSPENFYDFEGSGRVASKGECFKTETVLRENDNIYKDRDYYFPNFIYSDRTYKYGNYHVHNPDYKSANHTSSEMTCGQWLRSPVTIDLKKYQKKQYGRYIAYISQAYKEGIWDGDPVSNSNTTGVKAVYQIADGLGKYEISELNENFYNKCAVARRRDDYYDDESKWHFVCVGEGSKAQYIVTTNNNLNVNLNLQQWGVQYVSHRKKQSNYNPYDSNDEGLKNTTYILCGHYQEITTDILDDIKDDNGNYIFNNIQVFGGDTYIVPMNFARIKPSTFDCNQLAATAREKYVDHRAGRSYSDIGSNLIHAVSFPVQSKVNTLLKTGNDICKNGIRPYSESNNIGTYFPNNTANIIDDFSNESGLFVSPASKTTTREEFLYNTAYSSEHINNLYTPLITDTSTNLRHIYDFAWTDEKLTGETEDSFRLFPINNITQSKRKFGKIKKIIPNRQMVILLHEYGICYSYSNKEALTPQEQGEILTLGTSQNIFNAVYLMSDNTGLQDNFACIKGNNGIYFIDKYKQDIVFIENFKTVKSLALEHGISNNVKRLLRRDLRGYNMDKINESTNDFLSVMKNDITDEIYFVIKQFNDNGNYDLDIMYVYNEKLGIFTKTLPTRNVTGINFYNKEHIMLGNDNILYYTDYDSSNMNSFLGREEDAELEIVINNDLALEKVFSIMEIIGNNNLFSKIKIETENGTVEENLVSLSNELLTKYWRYYNNRWHGSYPLFSNGKRVTGNYISITFTVKAQRNYEVSLKEFITGYRKNY